MRRLGSAWHSLLLACFPWVHIKDPSDDQTHPTTLSLTSMRCVPCTRLLLQALHSLESSLRSRGSGLLFHAGQPETLMPQLLQAVAQAAGDGGSSHTLGQTQVSVAQQDKPKVAPPDPQLIISASAASAGDTASEFADVSAAQSIGQQHNVSPQHHVELHYHMDLLPESAALERQVGDAFSRAGAEMGEYGES